jgi:hypothetical protein
VPAPASSSGQSMQGMDMSRCRTCRCPRMHPNRRNRSNRSNSMPQCRRVSRTRCIEWICRPRRTCRWRHRSRRLRHRVLRRHLHGRSPQLRSTSLAEDLHIPKGSPSAPRAADRLLDSADSRDRHSSGCIDHGNPLPFPGPGWGGSVHGNIYFADISSQ